MAKALFVTGTGTDVGKTYISALMSKALREAGLNAAYYKAAVSGNVRRPDGSLIPGDARFVREFAHLDQGEETMCPYVYEHAWSPHLAAQAEGNPPELPVIRAGFQAVCDRHEIVTVEGSGGILCVMTRRKSCGWRTWYSSWGWPASSWPMRAWAPSTAWCSRRSICAPAAWR